MKTDSFYVKRTQQGAGTNRPDGFVAYVGPIRSKAQAEAEAEAWNAAVGSIGTRWVAEVLLSTPELRAAIREHRRAMARP